MLSLPKASVFPDTATVNNLDHLSIGGCDAVDLVKQHGSPLYVFDETTLRARCQSFRKEFGKRHQETQIAYASKAFINQGLAKLLAEEGLGFDVVSGGELAVVCAAGGSGAAFLQIDFAQIRYMSPTPSPILRGWRQLAGC